MSRLKIHIQCMDGDSAESLARSIKKNTLGYEITVILDHGRYFVQLEMVDELPGGGT